MLPLVGIVAIALLSVAGKFFFFPDLQDRLSVPVIVSPARASQPETDTKKNTRTEESTPIVQDTSSAPSVAAPLPATPSRAEAATAPESEKDRHALGDLKLLAVPYESQAAPRVEPRKEPPREVVIAVPQTRPQQPTAATRNPSPRPVLRPQAAANTPAPQPQQTRPAQSKPSAGTTAPAENKTPPPAQKTPEPAPSRPNWMVQVGAFSTQSAAGSFSERVSKAGYTTSVVSSKTLFRVLVQAGPTKEDALKLATQINQAGFQGAFIVPPR